MPAKQGEYKKTAWYAARQDESEASRATTKLPDFRLILLIRHTHMAHWRHASSVMSSIAGEVPLTPVSFRPVRYNAVDSVFPNRIEQLVDHGSLAATVYLHGRRLDVKTYQILLFASMPANNNVTTAQYGASATNVISGVWWMFMCAARSFDWRVASLGDKEGQNLDLVSAVKG